MVLLVVLKIDYGSMRVHEDNALRGDIYTTPDRPYANAQDDVVEEKGGVIDLVFPILVLIGCCITGMLYSGGFFSGVSFVEAFSASDASVGLMLGSFFAFVITVIFYALRRVLKFTDSMACIPDGFKAMVPGNPDPDICMDTESYDRQSWCGRVCGWSYGDGCDGTCEFPPGNYFPGGLFPCICDRNFLGNIRDFDSNRSCCIPGNK